MKITWDVPQMVDKLTKHVGGNGGWSRSLEGLLAALFGIAGWIGAYLLYATERTGEGLILVAALTFYAVLRITLHLKRIVRCPML